MVAAKFGKEKTRQSFESIKLKCNQKCRDKEKVGGDLDDGILWNCKQQQRFWTCIVCIPPCMYTSSLIVVFMIIIHKNN